MQQSDSKKFIPIQIFSIIIPWLTSNLSTTIYVIFPTFYREIVYIFK